MRLPQEKQDHFCSAEGQEITVHGEGWACYSACASDEASPPRNAGAAMTRAFLWVVFPSTEM